MTEYADKSIEEMASAFIVSTCQLLPKSISDISDHMHDLIGYPCSATKKYPNVYLILCGSGAEFYIRPPNTCIGDIDFLIARANELAFSDDFPVLPSDMSGLADMIDCYKIEKHERYPGFVRLRVLGEIRYNWKQKKYEFNPSSHRYRYARLNMNTLASEYSHCSPETSFNNIVSGPAIKHQTDNTDGYYFGSDVVQSFWCPQWPKEAKGWLQRPRFNGWPTIRTISEVSQNGCHVVYVQHRSCRDDELQWRLSFSFAEAILLQSWTPVQQIVYHLLRFFAKRELIQKNCPKEDEVLCPYHIKTLMLWTCEETSSEWWNSSPVIAICCELLQKLLEWLRKGHCPNYFIPEANLFIQPWSSTILDKTQKRLSEFYNSEDLGHWFVENYILPFIRKHFEVKYTMEVMPDFADYILPLLELWKVRELKSLDFLFFRSFIWCHKNSRYLIKNGFSSGLRQSLNVAYPYSRLVDYPKTENVLCLTYHDKILYILHIAYGLECGEVSWDSNLFVEFVDAFAMQPKIIRSKYHNFPKTYTTQSSMFQFLRAQGLMQNLTGLNSRPEFQLLSLMSTEFLGIALEYEDSKSNGIAPAALVYLAALHFATSEYQQAIRLCMTVLADPTPQNETLNAGCLLFIDDIARIVVLCLLHEKITNNNLHYIGKRLYLDLRLSPEVFAYYLIALSVERISNGLDLHHELPDSAFPMDAYLKAFIKPKCIVSIKSDIHFNTDVDSLAVTHFNATRQIVYRTPDSLTETESTIIVNPLVVKEAVIEVLMECALENMTSFYNVLRKDFGIQWNTVDCYRALYLYKCRKYDQVMHLCERILNESDLQSDLKEFSMVNVLLLPPLDSYFDADVQSLLGFHTLFCTKFYSSVDQPMNDDREKVEITDESTLEHWFARLQHYKKCGLSLSLYCRFSIKCHYFLGRHFLARYLKVRCCIDRNLLYKEALNEFAAQETSLPFEHIIRRFLLRKLRIFYWKSVM